MEDQNLMDIDTFFDDDWVPLVAMAMMADASTNTTAPPPPPQQPRPKPGLPSTILQELLPPAALPTDPCYFLNIPAEIRLMIYPYLLLPQVRIIFSKRGRFAPTPETDWVGDEYPLSIGEDEEYDELLKDYVKGTLDKRSRLRCEEMRRKISSWKLGHDPDEVVVAGDSKKEKWEPRHMAILRANQQIHDEASTQFYCDAILYMDPEDIFSLSDLPVPSEPTIWAYHPFGEGPKQLDKSQCEIEYVGHPRGESTGKLDPKVFARFQQIEFDLSFEGYFVPSEIWIDDETNVISDRTAKRYKKNLNRCRLIEDFVRLVSLLPKLALCVWLRVEVEAMSTRLEELEPEYDLDASKFLHTQVVT